MIFLWFALTLCSLRALPVLAGRGRGKGQWGGHWDNQQWTGASGSGGGSSSGHHYRRGGSSASPPSSMLEQLGAHLVRAKFGLDGDDSSSDDRKKSKDKKKKSKSKGKRSKSRGRRHRSRSKSGRRRRKSSSSSRAATPGTDVKTKAARLEVENARLRATSEAQQMQTSLLTQLVAARPAPATEFARPKDNVAGGPTSGSGRSAPPTGGVGAAPTPPPPPGPTGPGEAITLPGGGYSFNLPAGISQGTPMCGALGGSSLDYFSLDGQSLISRLPKTWGDLANAVKVIPSASLKDVLLLHGVTDPGAKPSRLESLLADFKQKGTEAGLM